MIKSILVACGLVISVLSLLTCAFMLFAMIFFLMKRDYVVSMCCIAGMIAFMALFDLGLKLSAKHG